MGHGSPVVMGSVEAGDVDGRMFGVSALAQGIDVFEFGQLFRCDRSPPLSAPPNLVSVSLANKGPFLGLHVGPFADTGRRDLSR